MSQTIHQHLTKLLNNNELNIIKDKLKKLLIKKQHQSLQHPLEIINKIWIGNYINATNKLFINDKQINVIISCLSMQVQHLPSITYYQIPIQDKPTYNITQHFNQFYEIINHHLINNQNIYIHCFSGISRCVAMIISYIMRKQLIPFQQAYQLVKSKYVKALPNSGFIDQLQKYNSIIDQYRQLQPKQQLILNINNQQNKQDLQQTQQLIIKKEVQLKMQQTITINTNKQDLQPTQQLTVTQIITNDQDQKVYHIQIQNKQILQTLPLNQQSNNNTIQIIDNNHQKQDKEINNINQEQVNQTKSNNQGGQIVTEQKKVSQEDNLIKERKQSLDVAKSQPQQNQVSQKKEEIPTGGKKKKNKKKKR